MNVLNACFPDGVKNLKPSNFVHRVDSSNLSTQLSRHANLSEERCLKLCTREKRHNSNSERNFLALYRFKRTDSESNQYKGAVVLSSARDGEIPQQLLFELYKGGVRTQCLRRKSRTRWRRQVDSRLPSTPKRREKVSN
jgi:hypothetical protein